MSRRRRRDPRGARRAREPRGVGHSVRRPAHVAHGHVHRAVRDVDGRRDEVQGVRDRLQRGARRRQARRRCRREPRTPRRRTGHGSGNGPRTGGTLVASNNVADRDRSSQQLLERAREQPERARRAKHQTLEDVQKQINAAPRQLGFGGDVQTAAAKRPAGDAAHRQGALPERPGRAAAAGGSSCCASSATVLKPIDNPIEINGYTDNVPIGPGGSSRRTCICRRSAPTRWPTTSRRSGSTESRLFPAGRGDQDFDRLERHGRGPGREPPGRDHRRSRTWSSRRSTRPASTTTPVRPRRPCRCTR